MAEIISKESIERVRNSVDIAEVISSYIPLKSMGGAYKALCPFHREKTPSFSVNPARGMFHCFGCGKGGDVFRFVMDYENVDFPTAVKQIAERAGIQLQYEGGRPGDADSAPSRNLYEANAEAARRYHEALLAPADPSAAAARDYLLGRSLPEQAWADWQIGYAPEGWHFLSGPPRPVASEAVLDAAGLLSKNERGRTYDRFRNRIVFSIRNELGRVVAFSARAFAPVPPGAQPPPKYVNTNETPVFKKGKILFGLDRAKRAILDARTALLCEGQIDCIRCHLCGFSNAVASQGTAFTADHARLLKRYADRVVIVLDGDGAGHKAALRTAELLMQDSLAVAIAMLPPGEDPDSLLLSQGADAFRRVLDAALTPVGFLLGLRPPEALRNPAALPGLLRELMDVVVQAPSAVLREQLLREASVRLAVSYESLEHDARRALRRRAYAQRGGFAPTDVPVALAPAPGPAQAAQVPPPPPPQHEFDLAVLLSHDPCPAAADFVRDWIRYSLVTHPDCRAILQALVEEGPHWLDALDAESDATRELAARVVNTPCHWDNEELQLQAAQDLVLRLWMVTLEDRRRDLDARRAAARAPEESAALTRDTLSLLSDLRALHLGFDPALPVLTRLLDEHDRL